eukprot:scaffold447_cov307-Pinguiococcus_pyrenoidosus.AAC.95
MDPGPRSLPALPRASKAASATSSPACLKGSNSPEGSCDAAPTERGSHTSPPERCCLEAERWERCLPDPARRLLGFSQR